MISVIIPVFRVEKYLDKCVQSIRNQTYRDLEIILVDDGSDDTCPSMCDRYAGEDTRIKVIHKANGGLSDARNAGIAVATGEYLSFVDSDDYIHPKMYERMMHVVEHNEGVDLVICPLQKIEEDDNLADQTGEVSNDYYIVNHDRLMQLMFEDSEGNFVVAWNKLYKRELWGELKYPVGKLHEDQFTTYIPLYYANKTGYMRDAFYYYRQRGGSIMSTFKERGALDELEAAKEKLAFFLTKEEDSYAQCVNRCLGDMIFYYTRAKKNRADAVAKNIRDTFLQEWRSVKQKKISGISKERTSYFNSFEIGDWWMNFYMNVYWKALSLERKFGKRIKNKYYKAKGKREAAYKENPRIATIEDTLQKIVDERCSVSRFGDGEYKWMADIPQTSFQKPSEQMARRLREIIKSEEENHLICLSDGFGKLEYLNEGARSFWYGFMGQHRKKWISYLKPGKQYYNTNMTRPYMDYVDKTPCKNRFDLLKKIWENRDVVLIEGKKSRLGVGNDLFDGAKSVKRILAPATNAFDKYDTILSGACKQQEDALYLLALGPTATILAYDLHKTGRQAVDVGHVDIEYEWYRMGATEKVTIAQKYVNEVDAGKSATECKDEQYRSQILIEIE